MMKAYLALWQHLMANTNIGPTKHILDNEASKEFNNTIKQNFNLQLVPPENKRSNEVEQAIGIDLSFLRYLWDRLLLHLSNLSRHSIGRSLLLHTHWHQ